MTDRPFVHLPTNTEYANGKVTGSNFPHYEVQSLPGYAERDTPSLTGSDVTKELARYLAEYAERNNCPLPYPQRETAMYIWWQASRGMLAWDEILNAIRAKKKRPTQANSSLLRIPPNNRKEEIRKSQEDHQTDPIRRTGR